ncbi:MAG: hypothetical protein U5J99_00005 [Parvularculaceae bacterium]|nr:hypothetical protein [Parvularculaceae bacterium]
MPFDHQPAENVDAGAATHSLRNAAPLPEADTRSGLRLSALAAALAAGLAIGAVAPASPAVADPDLARLMMAMAALKGVIVAGLSSFIGWRLTMPARAVVLVSYLAAALMMTAGLALMARMAMLEVAAIALHAGLIGAILMALRDRTIIGAIETALEKRRRKAR